MLLFGLFGWKILRSTSPPACSSRSSQAPLLGCSFERWVEPFVFETKLRGKPIDPSKGLSWDDRLQMAREEVVSILRKVWPYLLVGIGVGAVIHGWAPETWFAAPRPARSACRSPSVSAYRCTPTPPVMPLVEVLYDKGVPMGALLAFVMSVVALSLPELILLRRVPSRSSSPPTSASSRRASSPPASCSTSSSDPHLERHLRHGDQDPRHRLCELQQPGGQHPNRPRRARTHRSTSTRSPILPRSSAWGVMSTLHSSSTTRSCCPAACRPPDSSANCSPPARDPRLRGRAPARGRARLRPPVWVTCAASARYSEFRDRC